MVLLGLTGTALPLTLKSETLHSLSGWQRADMLLFVVLYFIYILIAITLLLNLLVAMLTASLRAQTEASLTHMSCRMTRATWTVDTFTVYL